MTHVIDTLDVANYLESLPRMHSHYKVDYSSMGFALKNYTEPSKINSPDLLSFLKSLFLQGEQPDKRKILPGEAMTMLRNAKKACGERRFKRQEWLKENQIRNLFGSFRDQLRRGVDLSNSLLPPDRLEDAISENIRLQKLDFDSQISSQLANPKPIDDQECPIMASTYYKIMYSQ